MKAKLCEGCGAQHRFTPPYCPDCTAPAFMNSMTTGEKLSLYAAMLRIELRIIEDENDGNEENDKKEETGSAI